MITRKTTAIAVVVLYLLFSYTLSFARPRKCSEHETQEERYNRAIAAVYDGARRWDAHCAHLGSSRDVLRIMKAGMVEGAIPHRVYTLLADGGTRNLKEIARALNAEEPHKVYTTAAQALYYMYLAKKVQRRQHRGRFVYWREDVVTAAAS